MRIKRRTISSSSIIQEQQSLRGQLITPQEAMSTTLAKTEAAQAVIKGAGHLMEAYQERVAGEEFSAAKNELDTAYGTLDVGLEARPMTDENGNLLYDPLELQAEEAEHRQKITDRIRGNIRGGRAQRMFDAYVAEVAVGRDADYLAKSIEKNNQFMLDRGEVQTQRDVEDNRWQTAIQRQRDLIRGGYKSNKAGQEEIQRIKETRDGVVLANELKREDITLKELNAIRDDLENGTWSSKYGLNEPKMAIDEVERLKHIRTVDAAIAGQDTANADRIKRIKEQNYRAILAKDELPTQEELLAMDVDHIEKGRWDTLWDARIALDEGGDVYASSADAIEEAYSNMINIKFSRAPGESLEDAVDDYVLWVRAHPELTQDDKDQLIGEAQKAISNVFTNNRYDLAFATLATKLGGSTRRQTGMGVRQDSRVEDIITAEAERAFYEYMITDPDPDPQKWLDENTKTYVDRALTSMMKQATGMPNFQSFIKDDGSLDESGIVKSMMDDPAFVKRYGSKARDIANTRLASINRLWSIRDD